MEFNKRKLIALQERKRAASLLLQDIGERIHEARSDVSRLRTRIEADAEGDQRVRSLLLMPLDKAQAIPDAKITSYIPEEDVFKAWARANNRNPDDPRPQWQARVNIGNWREYLRARATLERLTAERERQQREFNQQFDIVDSLCEFVKRQGLWFRDLEV